MYEYSDICYIDIYVSCMCHVCYQKCNSRNNNPYSEAFPITILCNVIHLKLAYGIKKQLR